jgi:predicted regulator of Ras-like GTPase activity (Roadblock/LC7/MglB family)
VHVLSESMTGASSVWNAMLGMWNHVKAQPGWEPSESSSMSGVNDYSSPGSAIDQPVRDDGVRGVGSTRAMFSVPAAEAPIVSETPPTVMRISRSVLDPARAKEALAGMLGLDGLLGCAVVDSTTGLVLARESRDGGQIVDMDLAAAACAQVLRSHRQAARSMGLSEHVDEVITTAGPRQQIMRTVSRHPELFLVVLLDKQRTNLALARFQLMEVERAVD